MRKTVVSVITLLLLAATAMLPAQLRVSPVGKRPDAATLDLLLRKLSSSGTFMQTDAHPDDEDNGLLAMLGCGQGMRTTLVTATRGDGGQNEMGPELGQALGVLRTEELLAAHRFDGAEQYFTRAIDFGYSFSIDETMQKWGHDEIEGDFVRQIRTIRPDVVVGFLCSGTSGGLHHQAAAELTREAFRAAGDATKYPEQIAQGLHPWQAVRYFCTDPTAFAPQPPPLQPDQVRTDVSGFDPLLGLTFAALGLEARSMHKCQGTSQLLLLPGQTQNRTYKLEDEVASQTGLEADGPAPGIDRAGDTLFDGIDTSLVGLSRFTGAQKLPALVTALQAIQQSVIDARAALNLRGPSAAIAPLVLGLRALRALRPDLPRLLESLNASVAGASAPDASAARYEIDTRLARKEQQFQDALAAAAGLRLDALADDGVVVPGQPVTVNVYAAAAQPAELRSVALAGFDGQLGPCAGTLTAAVNCKADVKIPRDTHLSTPYWTPRTDAARYDFDPDVPFGAPFRPSPFHTTFSLTIGGADVTVDRDVAYRYSDIMAGEKRSQLNVSPAFNVRLDPGIVIVPIGDRSSGAPRQPMASVAVQQTVPAASGVARKTLLVTVGNNENGAATVTVTLAAPSGWTVDPASQSITFTREDEERTATFSVTPSAGVAPGEFALKATATADGATSDLGYEVIEYPHIHRRHVIVPASTRVKAMDVAIAPGLKIGYIMGSGDAVPQAIQQLGASVTMIGPDVLASGDLSQFSAIVIGVRAYEKRADLRAHNQRLLDYAAAGGVVIVQYQRAEFNEAQYGPYPAKTTTERVTDENAPMQILQPGNPIFTSPNALGPDTWTGWVQERGTYFMGETDPRYVDLLASADPFPNNPGTKTGILVEAHVGSGLWIYTGLGLWRQLPAGVDGAYRLLANLLSLHP
ncbi:MAG: PIG-L family deacetylase [Vicinamibacterales bacterium]